LLVTALVLVALGALAATAEALHLQAGEIVVEAEGGSRRRRCPGTKTRR
jgi:hypothetical protein